MPELLAQALGSFLRHGLTILAGYIVAAGIWTQDEATTYVAAAVVALLGIGWSLWNKYKDKLVLNAALELPQGASLEQAKDKAAVEGSRLLSVIAVLAVSGSLLVGCGAKKAPVLVAQGGLAAAQSIGKLQEAGIALVNAGAITPQVAYSYQQKLLIANDQIKKLIPVLEAIDSAQKASSPTASLLEQALALLKSVSADLSIVVGGVPLSETTAEILKLVQATQHLISTVLVEVAKLQQALADGNSAVNLQPMPAIAE